MVHETIKLPVNYKEKLDTHGHEPYLVTYLMDNYESLDLQRKRPLVIICPGGGYEYQSVREAEPIAIKMNSMGFQAAVLYYSCAPMEFPSALCDVAEAVYYARKHADEWHVDANRIIVGGFSAGAHLAASLGVYWNGLNGLLPEYLPYKNDEIKPNALMLGYPVITAGQYAHRGSIVNVLGQNAKGHEEYVSLEQLVTKDVPPTFIWHTSEDQAVPTHNSIYFTLALQENHIPVEYHLFQKGLHGLALATEETSVPGKGPIQKECAVWTDLFDTWVHSLWGDRDLFLR